VERWFVEPEPLDLLAPRESRAPKYRPPVFICADFYRASVFTDFAEMRLGDRAA